MKEVLKPIYEWITGNFNLFDNPLYNYGAMAVIGAISFIIAWTLVGLLYRGDFISGGILGSLMHWVLRLLAFIVIFAVLNFFVWVINLILLIPIWGWWLLLIISLVILGTIMIKKIRKIAN